MAIINLQVAASSDDANEGSSGVVTLTASTVTVTSQAAWLAIRFQNVAIPPGTTVNAAGLQIYAHSTSFDNPNFQIYGEDADNAATFAATSNNISSRTRTSASVAWTGTNVGTGFIPVPDIKTIIQEIIDRPGWASGNAIVIILDALTGVSFQMSMYDFDAVRGAKIAIDHTGPPPPANVDLIRSAVVHSSYYTVQGAIDAATSSGDIVEVGLSGSPYFEALTLSGKTNLTIRPKAGEAPVIMGAIGELFTTPSGKWTLHGTINGFVVYYYTYPYSPDQVTVVREATGARLFTYSSFDLFVNGTAGERNHAGEGVYFDNAANRLYITLAGNANPNGVPLLVSFSNYTVNITGSSGCTIEDLTIKIGGEAVVRIFNSDDTVIQRCTLAYASRGIYLSNSSTCDDNIIQDCTLYDDRNSNWNYDDIKLYGTGARYMETNGLHQQAPGLGNIFRRNTFYGWCHTFNIKSEDVPGAPYIDGTLIYENTIQEAMFEAFSVENYSQNVQIYDNYAYSVNKGCACTPFKGPGPIHIYRNRFVLDQSFFYEDATEDMPSLNKRTAGQECDDVNFYHNTCYSTGVGFQMGIGAPAMTNNIVRNNIFVTTADPAVSGCPDYTDAGNDFDGNCYYIISKTLYLLRNFSDGSSDYTTLAAFRASGNGTASGWEVNGMEANPLISLGSYPYSLALTSAASPCVGAGVSIGALPDNTAYAGDLTIGAAPFETLTPDPGGDEARITGITRGAVNTTTGNQTFRDANLTQTPNAAIFILTSAIADGTHANHIIYSVGFAKSTSERYCVTGFEETGLTTTQTNRRAIEDGAIAIINNASTITGQGDFVQWEADAGSGAGVTINWSNAPDAAHLLTVIFFKATNVEIAKYLAPTTINTTVAPTVGFQADLIFFLAYSGGSPGSANGRHLSLGAATRTGLVQRCVALRSDDSEVAGTDVMIQYLDNRVSARLGNTGAVSEATELTAVGATDMTLTQRTGAGGVDEIGFMALEFDGHNVWVGDASSPTSTGLQTVTSPGFFPQLVMLALTATEAANTTTTDAKAGPFGIGVFNSDKQFSNSVYTDDAAATSLAKSLSDNRAIVLPADDGTAMLAADFDELNALGWKLNYTNVHANAKKIFGVAIQGASAGTLPILIYSYRRRRV